jgi:hypothetical protein
MADSEAEALAETTNCKICMLPFDDVQRLRMFSKCGVPATQHECSMCLSCMVNMTNSRCLCGRDMKLASWKRKI